jgi:transcriptional regulator with XRE-family HTH domain
MKPTNATNELGSRLKAERLGKRLSLHSVAKPAKISATYLRKLEEGMVKSPSPHVLQRLAGVLELPYVKLMELVGYVPPGWEGSGRTSNERLAELSSFAEDLTEEERRAVVAFIRYLKGQREGLTK